MVFTFLDEDFGLYSKKRKLSPKLDFSGITRVGLLALIYTIMGALLTLGIIFLLGTIGLFVLGHIMLGIGFAALTYSLLYGYYALNHKMKALRKYSSFIFN
jgi:hypothetical protein